jgi:hypothetical protein
MLTLESTGASQILAGLEMHALHVAEMGERLEKASDLIYQETMHRFDTAGDGSWPPLKESTIARKESQGYGQPASPLIATGDLYESSTSPNGPFSQRIFIVNELTQMVIMLVDWERDGWQIPVVLSEGTDDAGRGHHTRIPSRPIWPPADQMRDEVGAVLMADL